MLLETFISKVVTEVLHQAKGIPYAVEQTKAEIGKDYYTVTFCLNDHENKHIECAVTTKVGDKTGE